MTETASKTPIVNVAARLTEMAKIMPDAVAVVEPLGYGRNRTRIYRQVSFRQLDEDSDRIARGLQHEMGIPRGTRLALLVRPGVDFISLVFATLKAGMVSILIDPGMGGKNMVRCLAEAEPEGFVAIPAAQAVRTILRRRFPLARYNVTVGRRWFWGGTTLAKLRRPGHDPATRTANNQIAPTTANDAAAIIFTTGSTGPPKGVLYSHGNFDAQVSEIRDFYDIQQGEIDLPGFPLFGLFNCAMGVTTIIPDMDPSRPAQVDPSKIIEAVDDWRGNADVRLAGHLESRRSILRRTRQAAGYRAPRTLGRRAGARPCVATHERLHSPPRRHPHTLRGHRIAARGIDCGQ